MKKTLLLLLLSTTSFFGQVTNEGEPASWSMVQEKTAILAISLPTLDLESLRIEDEVNDQTKNKPKRIGVSQYVNYGLDNGGLWTDLPNGDRIWRILLESKGALNLSVTFDKFYLPEGSNLYLYNDEKTDLLGAYTFVQNNEKQTLGTWFVEGDKVWLEYYEPSDMKDQGKLNLSSLGHTYRMGQTTQLGYSKNVQKALNTSGDCNHDVNCTVGADFDSHKDVVKKSVAFLRMPDPPIPGQSTPIFICTGGLVNNTAQDNKPYFLTANHCLSAPADPNLFSMRFNWISPNPVCATAVSSTDAAVNQTASGATLRAKNAKTDFMLLEINQAIDPSWDVTYAGWNRSTTNVPTFNVGIHHPDGDIMKVSRDNDGAFRIANGVGDEFWAIAGIGVGDGSGGGWEIGTTEGGSSGSLLFDQDGLVIGQLFGGNSGCAGLTDNNEFDIYGRFGVSWDAGAAQATRLKEWLDPSNSGVTTLASKDNTLAVADEELAADIKIFPNPTNGILRVEISNRIGEYNYEIFNVLGQSIKKAKLADQRIQLTTLPSAMYFVKITEKESQKFAVKKVLLNK